jgi:hypothetical protein
VAEDVGLVLQAEATAAKEWQAAHQQVRQLLFGEEEAEEEHSDEDDAKSEYYSGEEMLGSLKVNSKSFWRIQGRLAIDERLSSSSRNSDGARESSVNLLGRDKHTALATSTGSSRGSNDGSNGIASDCPGTPVTGCFANPPAAAVHPSSSSSSSSSDGTQADSSSIDCPSSSIAAPDTAGRPLTTAIDSGADAQAPSIHLMLVMIKVPEVEAAASTETAQQPAAVEEEFNPVDWPVPVAKEPDQHSHDNRVVDYQTTQLQTSSSSKKPQQQTLIKKQQKQKQQQKQQQQQQQQQKQQQQQQPPISRNSPSFGLGNLLQNFMHSSSNSRTVGPTGGNRLVKGMHRVMGCGNVDAF